MPDVAAPKNRAHIVRWQGVGQCGLCRGVARHIQHKLTRHPPLHDPDLLNTVLQLIASQGNTQPRRLSPPAGHQG
jgi:hypothetical protein